MQGNTVIYCINGAFHARQMLNNRIYTADGESVMSIEEDHFSAIWYEVIPAKTGGISHNRRSILSKGLDHL